MVRLKLNYFYFFLYLGLFSNLLPGHFEDMGLSGWQRASIFSTIPLLTFIFNPLWGKLADQKQNRVKLISFHAFLSGLTMIIVFTVNTYLAYLLGAIIMGIFTHSIIPLNDSLTISYCKKKKESYGHFRQWGTTAFIAVNILLFFLYQIFNKSIVPSRVYLFLMPIFLIILSFSSRKIKEESPTEKHVYRLKDLLPFLKQPFIIMFLILSFLHNLAFSAMYSYFTPHLKNLNIGDNIISLSWALAPLAEIFIFKYSHIFITRIKISTLLLLAFGASALRWYLLLILTDPTLILLSQLLHSIAFGAYYLGAIELLQNYIPEKFRSTAQGIFAAICMNMSTLSGNILHGYLYEMGSTQEVFQKCFGISLSAFLVGFSLCYIERKSKLFTEKTT